MGLSRQRPIAYQRLLASAALFLALSKLVSEPEVGEQKCASKSFPPIMIMIRYIMMWLGSLKRSGNNSELGINC